MSESKTKSLVAEVSRQCREKGYKVDLTIAALLARAMDLHQASLSNSRPLLEAEETTDAAIEATPASNDNEVEVEEVAMTTVDAATDAVSPDEQVAAAHEEEDVVQDAVPTTMDDEEAPPKEEEAPIKEEEKEEEAPKKEEEEEAPPASTEPATEVILLTPDSPQIATLRLQVRMEEAFQSQKTAIADELTRREDVLDRALQTLVESSLDPDAPPHALASVHDRAFAYICHRMHLDAALEAGELRTEVAAAFESVFPRYLMPRFIGFTTEERLVQLEEIASIVLGVCAYHAMLGQAGVSLSREFSLVGYTQQAAKLRRDITSRVEEIEARVMDYTLLLNHHGQSLAPDAPGMVRLKDEVTFLQQELAYALQMEDDVHSGLDIVQAAEIEARQILQRAHETVVAHKLAVPKEQVFPLFDQVGALYLTMADEKRMLRVRQSLFATLRSVAEAGGFRTSLQPIALRDARAAGHRAAATSVVLAANSRAPFSGGADAVLIAIERVGAEARIELGGYCPVTLVRRGGLLLPAATDVGLVHYDGKLFGCSSRAFLQEFVSNPEFYLEAIRRLATERPELIKLLGLVSDFPSLNLASLVASMATGLKCDFATQTETHVLERNIDPNYDWNVWSLRRKALRLANLRQCRTHGAQTVLSHFRRENDTQTWLPKSAVTQTLMNKGQQMPKKMQYVAGLRGSAKSKMTVCRLELDIQQPHQL